VFAEIVTLVVTGLAIWASLWFLKGREKRAEKGGDEDTVEREEKKIGSEGERVEKTEDDSKRTLGSKSTKLNWPWKRSTNKEITEDV
jgi:hypothetical protein